MEYNRIINGWIKDEIAKEVQLQSATNLEQKLGDINVELQGLAAMLSYLDNKLNSYMAVTGDYINEYYEKREGVDNPPSLGEYLGLN